MLIEPEKRFTPTNQVVGELLERYNLELISYKPAASGIENTTLLVTTTTKDCVVRIYREGKKTVEAIYAELSFMHHLSKNGLAIPKVLHNRQQHLLSGVSQNGKKWQAIVMERSRGIHAPRYTSKLIENLATSQATMHELADTFPNTSELQTLRVIRDTLFAPKAAKLKLRDKRLKDFVERAAAYSVSLPVGSPSGACHLDFDKDNVLVDGDTITAILDFDDLAIAPYAVCLGYTLRDVYAGSHSMTSVIAYLDAYQDIRPLQKSELRLLRPIMLARHYMMSCLHILDGKADNAHIQKYLEQESKLLDERTLATAL